MNRKQQQYDRVFRHSYELLTFITENWISVLIFCIILFLLAKYGINALDAKQERNNDKRLKNLLNGLEAESKIIGSIFNIFLKVLV
jgi:hypothetical protein